jgi:hypothetical protein
VPAQQWAYEAGGSEEAGRVIEPRNMYSGGQKDSRSGIEVKADGLHAPEADKKFKRPFGTAPAGALPSGSRGAKILMRPHDRSL